MMPPWLGTATGHSCSVQLQEHEKITAISVRIKRKPKELSSVVAKRTDTTNHRRGEENTTGKVNVSLKNIAL